MAHTTDAKHPDKLDILQARIAELERKLKVAVEALHWYADPSTFGDKARKALEEIK